MRGYGAGIDPITSGHFPFRNKLCMFIGDYDMFPVKIKVILDFKTDPVNTHLLGMKTSKARNSIRNGERILSSTLSFLYIFMVFTAQSSDFLNRRE